MRAFDQLDRAVREGLPLDVAECRYLLDLVAAAVRLAAQAKNVSPKICGAAAVLHERLAEYEAAMKPLAAQACCCICREPLAQDPPRPEDQWHWGPDGLHCHFRCEDEFRRRYRLERP